jgi:hypothetical protein
MQDASFKFHRLGPDMQWAMVERLQDLIEDKQVATSLGADPLDEVGVRAQDTHPPRVPTPVRRAGVPPARTGGTT